MTTKNFLIILSFLSFLSCGPADSVVENLSKNDAIFSDLHLETTDSIHNDTIRSIFRVLDHTKIKEIEISNFQFDKDTGLTGFRRHLNVHQISELCRKINGFSQIDSIIDYCSYPHKLKYSFLITYTDNTTGRIDVLTNLLDQYATTMKNKAVKKIIGNQYFDTLWTNSIEPICDCDVMLDDTKIKLIDSVRKKHKINVYDGIIKKDSNNYFQIDFWSSDETFPTFEFKSIWIQKNDHIYTRTRMHSSNDTLFLSSAPFNSAKIIQKVSFSKENSDIKDYKMIVNNCYKGWLYVTFKYRNKTFSGWTKNYCSNPYTTCS